MKTYPALCFRNGHDYDFVHPTEIIHVKSEGSYSQIWLQSGQKLTVCKKLKEIASALPESLFVRVHHSNLINLMYVEEYQPKETNTVKLISGHLIRISKRKKAEFLSRFIRI